MLLSRMSAFTIALAGLALLTISGCGGADAKGPPADKHGSAAESESAAVVNWCNEHGVQEDQCAQCKPKVAAEFKKKGDWCEEHNCPKSQCFVCNPQFEPKIAAEYEAQYGVKPPKRGGKCGEKSP
jgi:hypothetical protein